MQILIMVEIYIWIFSYKNISNTGTQGNQYNYLVKFIEVPRRKQIYVKILNMSGDSSPDIIVK